MKAKFDDDLQFKSDGRKLKACGPLEWDAPDGPQGANKVTVTVQITQNAVVAEATSAEFDRTTSEWMIDLRPGPGQKFQAGAAQGTGTLTVTDPPPNGGASVPHTFSWQGAPTLAEGAGS